jgi:hypothetical protein
LEKVVYLFRIGGDEGSHVGGDAVFEAKHPRKAIRMFVVVEKVEFEGCGGNPREDLNKL